MAIECDFQFPHRYEVEEVPELPGEGRFPFPVHYFPGSKTRPEHDGMWVTIHPENADPWIGVLAFGYGSPPVRRRILSLPDPERICIVSDASAYVVQATDPATWEELPLTPVTDVRAIPEARLVVLADFTRLIAVGQHGIAWKSPRVVWDDLKILNVTAQRIEGVGYDPGGSGRYDLPFAVELTTGRALIPPPLSLNRPPYS